MRKLIASLGLGLALAVLATGPVFADSDAHGPCHTFPVEGVASGTTTVMLHASPLSFVSDGTQRRTHFGRGRYHIEGTFTGPLMAAGTVVNQQPNTTITGTISNCRGSAR